VKVRLYTDTLYQLLFPLFFVMQEVVEVDFDAVQKFVVGLFPALPGGVEIHTMV